MQRLQLRPVRHALRDRQRHGRNPGLDGRFQRGMRRRIAAADVQGDRHVGVVHGLEERLPIVVVDAGQALHGRVLVHRDGTEALLGQAVDLGDRGIHVPGRQDAERDETAGIGHAPFVVMPVVIGLHVPQRELLVRRLVEGLAVKADGVAEAQRRGDAVDVHVVDAGMHVVTALAQLVEGSSAPCRIPRTAGRRRHSGRSGGGYDPGIPSSSCRCVGLELRRAGQQVARRAGCRTLSGGSQM